METVMAVTTMGMVTKMKYLLVALLLAAGPVYAENSCKNSCEITKQDVNTPVPIELKGAKIIVRSKDGKEHEVRAEDYKVVPRKQQFKIVKKTMPCNPVIIERTVTVETEVYAKQRKNVIIGGLSYGYTSLSSESSSSGTLNSAKVYSNKGPIADIGYMRRRLFDSNFGAGLSINTTLAPRAFLGYEF